MRRTHSLRSLSRLAHCRALVRQYRKGDLLMRRFLLSLAGFSLFGLAMMMVGSASATGLATCKSGPESGWKSQDALKAKLAALGWEIRRIKIDGGCYEVYALNENK
jgi:hypothetical protein